MASDRSSTQRGRGGAPRVLFVTRKWAPAMGGMETYSMRLTEELAKITSIEVVALPGRENGHPPRVGPLLGFPFAVVRQVIKHRRTIDVLHLADMAIWPLGLLAKLCRKPVRVVLSAHGTDVAYHRRRTLRGWLYGVYLRLGSKILSRAKVIANSRATRDVAAETGWHDAAVVPLATDITAPPPDGTHDGSILFAGRLVERKGCGWFIREVLPLLPQGIRLKVAGTVWDEMERAALSHPRVDFIGNLGGEDLVAAYRRALCLVVPNIEPVNGEYEGFGLIAVEAAAAGGLVIAADCGGLRDAVVDGMTGIMVTSGDAGGWAEQISALGSWTSAQRATFLADATRHATNHFNWQRVAQETLALYN